MPEDYRMLNSVRRLQAAPCVQPSMHGGWSVLTVRVSGKASGSYNKGNPDVRRCVPDLEHEYPWLFEQCVALTSVVRREGESQKCNTPPRWPSVSWSIAAACSPRPVDSSSLGIDGTTQTYSPYAERVRASYELD